MFSDLVGSLPEWLVDSDGQLRLGDWAKDFVDWLTANGAWFFDRTDKTINYLLGSDTFSSGTSNLLKFKVELSRTSDPSGINGGSRNPGALAIGEVRAGPTHKPRTRIPSAPILTERN